MSSCGGDGGVVIIANRAAKQLTIIQVTPLDIFRDACGYFNPFLWQKNK